MNGLKEYVEKLDHADEAERIYAAEDIGYLNSPDGVPALLGRLEKERSRAVCDAIFQAFTRIDADNAIEGCIGLLQNDDPQIRNQATEVLRRKGGASIPFLNAVMQEGDKDLRKLVLDVLSGVQTSGTEAIYEAALSDQDPNVVITGVENLGNIRSHRFRTRIEGLLQTDAHPMLVSACIEALVAIGDESSLPAIRQHFPDLTTLPDFFLASCLKAIAVMGSRRDLDEVVSLLSVRGNHLHPAILNAIIALSSRSPSPDGGERLLPVLRVVVENGDPPLCRYQATRALGFLAAREDAYSFLVSCLSSPERLVRLGAAEALREAAPPGFQQLLDSFARTERDDEVLLALNC